MGFINNLIVRIKGDNKDLDKKLKQSEGSVSKFSGSIKALGGVIAAAFSVGAIVSFGKEVIGLAAKAEGVRTAFQTLNNPSLLGELRRATRGTVDDITLMQKAVQARNFKIPIEQLAGYFEFATNRAIQTGESVDYLVDSIITGIGRKSVLVMDNLGISAVELQEEVQRVGDFGAAAGIIIQRELEKAGEVADTTAIKFAQLSTTWQNFKETVGQKINQSKGFQGALDWVKDFTTILKSSEAGVMNTLVATIFKRKELVKDVQKFEDAILEAQKKQTAEIQKQTKIRAPGVKRVEGGPTTGIAGITSGVDVGAVLPLNQLAESATQGGHVYSSAFIEALEAQSMSEQILDIMQQMTQQLADIVGDVLESTFQAIGAGNFEGLGKEMLSSFADFLSQLGRLMVAYGVLNSAFYKSLAAGPLGGAIAIGAGLAAIAVAGLIKGAISSAGSAMGGSGGYSGASSGGGLGIQTQAMTIQVEGVLKGSDIAISSRRYSKDLTSKT